MIHLHPDTINQIPSLSREEQEVAYDMLVNTTLTRSGDGVDYNPRDKVFTIVESSHISDTRLQRVLDEAIRHPTIRPLVLPTGGRNRQVVLIQKESPTVTISSGTLKTILEKTLRKTFKDIETRRTILANTPVVLRSSITVPSTAINVITGRQSRLFIELSLERVVTAETAARILIQKILTLWAKTILLLGSFRR